MKILVVGDFQGILLERFKKRIEKEEFDLVVGVGDFGGLKDWKPYIMDFFRRLKKGEKTISSEKFLGKKKFKKLLKKEFESVRKILIYLNKIKKPIIIVFGNSDDDWYHYPGGLSKIKLGKKEGKFLKTLKNVKIITYGKRIINGFNFVGFGGYMDIEAYFKKRTFKIRNNNIPKIVNRHKKVKRKFFNLIQKSNKKLPKIFVFHYPPYGVFDIIKDKRNPMDGESAGVKFFAEAMRRYKPKIVFCGHMEEYQGMKKLYGIPVINPGAAQWGRYCIVDLDEEKGRIKNIKFWKGR